MIEIKKIKKISLANACAFLSAVFAFVLVSGFYGYALVAAIRTGKTAQPLSEFIWFNVGVGLLSGVFAAFLTSLLIWSLVFLFSGLYNIFAKRSGGVMVDLEGLPKVDQAEDKQERLFPF